MKDGELSNIPVVEEGGAPLRSSVLGVVKNQRPIRTFKCLNVPPKHFLNVQFPQNNNLHKITERTSITKQGDAIVYKTEEGEEATISNDTLVSMNFWGFTPAFLEFLEVEFNDFLEENVNELKTEFFLPFVVDNLIQNKQADVKVIGTDALWMGVTYKEDKDIVVNKVKELIDASLYPSKLW